MVALAPPILPEVRSIPTRSGILVTGPAPTSRDPIGGGMLDVRGGGDRRWRARAPPSSTTGLRTTTVCTAISSISVEDSSAAYPWVLRLVGCHLMLQVLLEVPG
jgi:hypothetical protein